MSYSHWFIPWRRDRRRWLCVVRGWNREIESTLRGVGSDLRLLLVTGGTMKTSIYVGADTEKTVVNLSGEPLQQNETRVLAKGLNFVPTPKNVPLLDIITSAEACLGPQVPRGKAAEIRGALLDILSRSNHKAASNTTAEERRILKRLRQRTDLVITKADKGNVVVLLHKGTYLEKMNELLKSDIYTPIAEDPTDVVRKTLISLLQYFEHETDDTQLPKIRNYIHYICNSQCPEIYGLPKIHKPGVPLRPVKIIMPLTGNRTSSVKNSRQFCAEIKMITLRPSDILVSYDVKDLFTSIPMDITLNALENLLDKDSTLSQRTSLKAFHVKKLVSFCMKEANYFRFGEQCFMQNSGAPMGSSLSPVLAEVFMEHLEEIAFSTANESIVPVLFKRYVDDVFAITKSGEDEAFLNHLNSLFPACISFTIEKEEDGRLPFLDALIIKEGDRLKTTVYRKPTHSDRYLHFSSHHPRSVMRGVISGMVERARAICDEEFLAKELGHIKTTFFSNGYPAALISSATTHATARPEEHVPSPTAPLLILPYYNGLGEKIKRMGRTVGFQVYFKSAASVRSIVRNDKVRMAPNEKPGVIYEILCTCSASYIGETGNSLSHRYEQHLNCLNRYKNALDDQRGLGIKRRGRPRKLQPNEAMDEAIKASAIVEHASRCDGQMHPNVIANEPDFRLRKIKEALYIRHNVVINRDKGQRHLDQGRYRGQRHLDQPNYAKSVMLNNNRLTYFFPIKTDFLSVPLIRALMTERVSSESSAQ
ncbi:hypothetical protein M513_08485 [Trichuris suis]|uniref:Reverse transcriptase domain-containing protein n=3 Tax=Trichuris suis TaxID=68888 RepID=A0A085M0D2_9BILA|nr:hypothetical protein M513_08485 [Trichuris suis]